MSVNDCEINYDTINNKMGVIFDKFINIIFYIVKNTPTSNTSGQLSAPPP